MEHGLKIVGEENKLVYNNGIIDMDISDINICEKKLFTNNKKFCYSLTNKDLETYKEHRENHPEYYI